MALNIRLETLETCGAEIDSWQIIISIYFYLSNHLKVTKSTKKSQIAYWKDIRRASGRRNSIATNVEAKGNTLSWVNIENLTS